MNQRINIEIVENRYNGIKARNKNKSKFIEMTLMSDGRKNQKLDI